MPAYEPSAWDSWSVAMLGASAVLIGLIFVGLSINLDRLLKAPWLFRRAAAAITLLAVVFTVTALLLVPGQSTLVLGTELVAVSLAGSLLLGWLLLRGQSSVDAQYRGKARAAAASGLAAMSLILVAGIAVTAQAAGGLYWLVPGLLLCTLRALLDAWVLLVEVTR